MPGILDRDPELGALAVGQPRVTGNRADLACPAFLVDRNERHLPIVVDEADPGQPVVRHPLAQLERLQVTQVHTLLRESLVELGEEWLVLRRIGRMAIGTPSAPCQDVP